MRWARICGLALLCALSSPLWIVGAALAWLHYVCNKTALAVIKYGLWLPTRWPWTHLVRAYRNTAPPADPEAAERAAHAARFQQRARRGRRGVR